MYIKAKGQKMNYNVVCLNISYILRSIWFIFTDVLLNGTHHDTEWSLIWVNNVLINNVIKGLTPTKVRTDNFHYDITFGKEIIENKRWGGRCVSERSSNYTRRTPVPGFIPESEWTTGMCISQDMCITI